MGEYKQQNRKFQLFTPLGEDVLLLQGFTGQEAISRMFHFDLRLHSENRAIAFDSIVGKQATIKIILADNKTEQYINGLINTFSQAGSSSSFAYYHVRLVPWIWMLTQTSNCRIFQNMTVPDIIQQILDEHIKRISHNEYADFKLRLHRKFEPREYCVQYRETDFNFVSRLMEEEGIFYFFEHEAKKHTLVLADHYNEFKVCKNQATIRYELSGSERRAEEVINEWSIRQEIRPGQYELNDFDFKQPALDLTANVIGKDERKFEIYDYPGKYYKKNEGEERVSIRMEEEDVSRIVAIGSSTSRAFVSGSRFKLVEHYRKDLNSDYVLTSIHHIADQGSNYRSSEANAIESFDYRNHFQAIPYPSAYRPTRVTATPIIYGSQTAIVVGPKGEEIHVDNYGRVKVQFHWDREGKYDENSSCWVRVSQNWAGKRWGAMFLPRIGQEVIVDFLEGDPDRPIITGRVYNGSSMPPYELPGEKTKSTTKSYSSKGGEGFNEMRFEDKKGLEQIFIHAQRNKDIRIKKDLFETIGSNSHLIVGGDQLESIGNDKHLTIKNNHNEKEGGSFSRSAGGDICQKAGENIFLQAGNEIDIKSGTYIALKSGSISLVGDGGFITIDSSGIYINGTMVYINSGGMAIPAMDAQPTTPKKPKEADTGVTGEMAELPPAKRARKVSSYSPGALAMKKAAIDGVPFVEM
ncbi:MAG: type VI secretion system tip protein VgrG [Acidobacteria bacterium]|nr:type VI secretion system tip protein VgrG [Acidobacteriota bacterium]